MSILSGSKLGPYEILVPLGAGGMGEVHRALLACVSTGQVWITPAGPLWRK